MKPVDVLQKGLAMLRNQICSQKATLEANLKANKCISEADEEWLDNAGNLVDKECVVEKLDNHLTMTEVLGGPVEPANVSGNQKKSKSAVEFKQKENATLAQCIEILDWHHANGKNQMKTAKHFNAIYPSLQLKQPRISAWCKYKETWQAEYENSAGTGRSAK
ncbi:hypothetical protein PISMIDRAFT_23586 [Pisolithus microcarpus 441]|uniref:Unplaced genomic scaffold scaffold_50, whole genome shotgun sequence n=1 Tax=Pisolithus microcarpus 441 TaxID=765257 RepID=A0A0C9ZK87_9AGAM|nr:hypothetical protein BKA83DRAFT_23586 [Pisolithus microcarpus]KIK22857.1 hypothetical protein PISMIDRAFT_23586 [Pisolithus microcarpus 441]